MRIAVTGSIATDHVMTFPGRIADQLLVGHLDHVSLSFLVDELEIRDGGVAANIAYGLAGLGHRALLVGAAGVDFRDHGARLAGRGVDISGVRLSATRPTARFLCTTDPHGNRLASFHPGAMAEACDIDLAEVVRRCGGADLVLVGADDPSAMLRHTRACRDLSIPFAVGPSQQLARLGGADIGELVDGADCLFTDEYERGLLLGRTGWTETEVLRRTGTWVTTLGGQGCRIDRAGRPTVCVPGVTATRVVDPTGVGAAFRAGYLASLAEGLAAERCARQGAALAALALSAVGTQTYDIAPDDLDAC
ncbi:carbohydrate kinase family protein [Streptomyces sp. NBC_00285]|uniref:carbohydrate kinase family protein n=1 Tax=Streptomyces sp. NBC_00285 TaxID=2975700 RepID=UPI002E284473|nr:carbohydrate kinase family protein [Streptomyces sp. NBC_00285]